MPSLIWTLPESIAKRFIRFGRMNLLCDVKDGTVVKVTIALGETSIAWTLEDALKGRDASSLLE